MDQDRRNQIFERARQIARTQLEPEPAPFNPYGQGAGAFRRECARQDRLREEASFYDTREWLELRYRALKLHGGFCQCCGNAPVPGNPLQVDHIKPRSKYPELELDLHNLQVLCKSCNMGKGGWDQTDWRSRR